MWYTNRLPAVGYFYTLWGNKLVTVNDYHLPQYGIFDKNPRGANDKLSICFDADIWTVTWYKNDEQIGEPFKVMPNKEYHLFVRITNGDGRTEYRRIVDY